MVYLQYIIYKIIVILLFILFSWNKSNYTVPDRPNILFILVDDLGCRDLSIEGSNYYETPNVDRIGRSGFRFSQGYSTSGVCSPSRASIMLGKFTVRHGITDYIGARSGIDWLKNKRYDSRLIPADYRRNLPKADTTIAESFKDAGYLTFYAGKWHLGYESSYPEDHGFNVNIGGWESGSPKGGYFSPWENPKLPNIRKGENLSLRLAKETSMFINENKNKPFFAFLSFYAVHSPIQTTEIKWEKYRKKSVEMGIYDNGYKMENRLPIRIVQDNPIYAGLVEQMDDAVGIVLEALEKNGIADKTIIVFTSDNGGVSSGDAFSTSNLPFRGGKGYQWEGGIRVPFFIHIPWIKGNKIIETPVTNADLYPTLLDLVGLPLKPYQHVDGISLKPLIEGKIDQDLRERALYWHYPHYGNQGGEPSSIIRKGDWKLIHYWERGLDELYNIKSDPYEQKDISAINQKISLDLHNMLFDFIKENNGQIPVYDANYNSQKARKLAEYREKTLLPNLEKERKSLLDSLFKPNQDWWGSKIIK